MKRLPVGGLGFLPLLLLLFPLCIWSQPTEEDLMKMAAGGSGFQFHLKFNGTGNVTPFDAKYNKITALLDLYKGQVPGDIQSPFRVQGPDAAQRPFLTESQQVLLKDQSTRFFRDMAAQGLTVQDLQRYKEVFKNKNPMPGDNPIDPRIAWKEEFQGIERTLMGGRTLLVMDVWKQTMVDYFNTHPEAVGVVYGQMDIGSWVKMSVDGLGFAADIDFGTIATDAKANKAIHDLFADNLKRASGLGMIPIDVVHTAHGLAGAEVFIGEWGKAFAEVDMLRRGKWKLLIVEKNGNGQVVNVRTEDKNGKDLFMEKGAEQELKAQQKDPANQFDPREKYPELRIDMEPMLSLEMLRHAMHDIEHGPFEGGQKIIKMIKYTERSFFMIGEALKNVSPQDQSTYFSLSAEEQQLRTLCDEVIKNKGNASKIATLLEAFTGKKLESNEQVNLIVDDIVQKCKKAMLKNANQAFGFRTKQIAQIEDEGQRFEEADKFLKQMEEEFKKGYEAGKTEIPATMKRAHSILVDLRAGKISPDQLNAKLEELNKLMEEEYKVDKSFIERLVGDPFGPVRKYLIEKGYGPEAVQKMITKFKEKFVENWKYYAPEYAQRTTMTAYEYGTIVRNKLNSFNEHLAKTKTGRVLSSELLNHIDNTIALYDAWMSGKDLKQSAWRVSWTVGTIWAQGKWPFLAIPLGIYNSIETKSVAPAAMAVAFYMFPMAGQVYMVVNIIDRLVVSNVREYTFRNHLDRLATMARTDGEGHVILFRIPKAFNGLNGSADSLETEPNIPVTEPGRSQGIKEIFYDPSFLYCPDIKYFESLVPRKGDQFGMYETKVNNLKSLFYFDNEFLGYLIGIEKFKKDKEEKLLEQDDYSSDRDKMLDSLETVLEDHLWMAIFTAIESTKLSEKKGALEELEAAIVRVQDSLFLDDYRMKKIDSLSLLLKIRKVVQNDPLYIQALKDKFSAGTAYARVAIPTMERYLQVYRQIIVIQEKIFDVWHPFGINSSAIQNDPLRLLLMGGLSGAPMLTTDPDKDLQVAIQCLDAHTRRASKIRMDLANALGRPIKDEDAQDKEHLRILGEWGFGFEHLVDANPNGRSPLFPDEAGVILKKMQEYEKAYNDYLNKLKEGPTVKLKLQLKGEKKTMETVPITAEVTVVDEKGKAVSLPSDVKIIWNKVENGQEVKAGEGNAMTEKAESKGYVSYVIHLQQTRNNKTTDLDKTWWDIQVDEYNLGDPSKGIKINIPSVIRQYDFVDVSAELPAALKGRAMKCSWGYETLEGMNDCSKARLQFIHEQTQRDKDGKEFLLDSIGISLTVEMPEPGKYSIPKYITRRVKFQHMALNAKVTDIWEGGSGPAWVAIKRKEIKSPQRVPPWSEDKKAVSTASAYAQLNVKAEGPFAATVKTLDELKAYVEKEYDIPANKSRVLKSFNLGDFKGYGVYTAGWYANGGWSDLGYRAAGASAGFEGFVMKGKAFFKVTWWAGASGAFDNSDKGWMMAQINQLDKECQSIVGAMSLQPDGRLTKSPYTGPKLDGSDYPMVVIEPKVDTIQPGSKVLVKATVKNDKAEYGPYTYAWSGHVEGNDKDASAQLVSDRPGKKSITVSVDGNTPPGSATLEYIVAPLKVRIVKVSPPTTKIIVGMPVELRADFAGAVPAGKKLQYRWQPHPEEKFDPFESEKNTTKLVFATPGHKKIWVQVLDKTTAETITLGESDQLELDVEKPSFTVTFAPPKAPVGQPVLAKISSVPDKLEEVNYRWLPLPSNATLLRESQDGSEITFYAKDAMQVPVEVLALVKGSGEELGKVKAYFSAERYQVKTEGPKVQGPKPMIWKPGQGLVEVDKEIAVHQVVEFTVTVTPQPTSSLTYDWKLTGGNASISNPASRDARVTALETGQVQLTVTIKDNNGVELGSALASFNATISNEMISNGAKQKKDFDNKMQQARQLIKEGKLDEAFTLGNELKGLNPKEAAPLLNELGTACKKAGKDAAYERDFTLAAKRYDQALQLNPNDTEAKKQLDQVKKWQKEWPTVEAKGREMESAIAQQNLPAAFKCLTDLNNLQFNMPGQMANQWSQEKQRHYHALTKKFDSTYTIAQSNWKAQFLDKDFETALTDWEGFKKTWTPFPATAKEIDGSIQLCKSQIAEKKKIYDDFVQTKNKLEQGLPTDPKLTPAAFEYQAINRFSGKDPRRQEMIDFARNWDKRQKDIQANKALATQKKNEGQQAESRGDIETALGKYRESVALVPDAELSAKIRKLETEWATVQAAKNKADALWNEGEKLTKKKKTREEGLGKMKESLEYWNGPERINTARETEKDVNGKYSSVDMTGTWKHGANESFTFAATGDGIYSATEKGFGYATGTLTLIGNMGILSYTTRDKLTGQYILKIAADGNSAAGQWTDSRKSTGQRSFTRIGKPPVKEPDEADNNDKDKKKKGIGGFIDKINKGLNKIDSALNGKKPDEKGVEPPDANKEEKIADNGNLGGVSSGPSSPTRFTLTKTVTISRIENYHYFNRGTSPGTIGLKSASGKMYGPWKAYGLTGQGGVQNAYWNVLPEITLPAGTYTVIDSDPSTWSYNSESKGCGFTRVWIRKVTAPIPPEEGPDVGVNPADPNKEQKIFDNGNIGGVSSGPTSPTVFTFGQAVLVTRIENYHYFNNGKKPGTIALRGNNGTVYGPWQAHGLIGQGGVQNAYWAVLPNVQLPAGTYTVIDSDPSTWSYNSGSKGCGFTTIWTSKSGKPPVTVKPGHKIENVETGGGVTAEKIFITGDIDNLGFGFPKGFDVFSGNNTPVHGYPWKVDPNDAKGTDRIMVGSGARGNSDGYSANTNRADNRPEPITLWCDLGTVQPESAVLQLFLDDFQSPPLGSKFSVTINGKRAPFLESVINSLSQTGPIGKLVSVKVPNEYFPDIRSGKLAILIDDATTGVGDGYAVDFVRLVINPSSYSYTGTITGVIYRPDGQPAAGALISAGGIISGTTNSKGEFTLKNVPAGMVNLEASFNNHHHTRINADLAAGKTIKITINLPAD